MSKGNMLLGYARGSVGDVTFSRVKGNQVAKARNRHPSNPKTSKQVIQRAKFLNAVNFYKRGVQNLFKFAYEDKTEQESDFNAFMRHNVSRAIPVGYGVRDNALYPAISNWLTSYGSLTGPQAVLGLEGNLDGYVAAAKGYLYAMGEYNVTPGGTGDDDPSLNDKVVSQAIVRLSEAGLTSATFGALCASLKEQYPDLLEGDIVTITMIHQIIQGIGQPQLLYPTWEDTEGLINQPRWSFCQFRIDSTSTSSITDAITAGIIYLSDDVSFNTSLVTNEGIIVIEGTTTWQQVKDSFPDATTADFVNLSSCTAAVMTFSRETPTGLKVSTQEFSTSYGYQQMIDLSKRDNFTEGVLVSWGASDDAILQGSFVPA